MWENLNVYKQLDKKDIYRTFKQLGVNFISLIDGYLNYPATAITRSEYLKPDGGKIHEQALLTRIRSFALTGDFDSIEKAITA